MYSDAQSRAVSQQKAVVKNGDIAYTLTTDKAAYGAEDPVDLTFTITNTGKSEAKFEFPTTQYYDFIITRGIHEIARWSFGQTFVPNPPARFLAAGKSMSFSTRWLQKDQHGRLVGPGAYDISAVFNLKDRPVTVTLRFQKGLLTAFPDNTVRPSAQVTRAEFAALHRARSLELEAVRERLGTLELPRGASGSNGPEGGVA